MPQDAPSLASLMELVQRLMEEEGYVEGTTVVVALGSGVHEVVGSWVDPWGETYQKTLSVPCNHLSFVGQGDGVTIVEGGLVVENGRKVSVEGLTMKSASRYGVVALGAGTEIVLKKMTVEECQSTGVGVYEGAKFVATECHFHQNGGNGVSVGGSTTTARLTNCTSHHNKDHGVVAYHGAVVDLMGEGTSVHDNERFGLCACSRGTTINVYQPCVLNDMSHGNKGRNIFEGVGGIVQQKDSKK
jgi:acyl-coenzyme A thioesterase PaaI-like protein